MAVRGSRGGRGGARPNAGGPRQGTPGHVYANRTDLASDYAPTKGLQTPAIGSLPPNPLPATNAPAPGGTPLGTATGAGAPPVSQVGTPAMSPDDVPSLDAPTQRPGEPVTAGLPFGAGPGPTPPASAAVLAMKSKLPYLMALTRDPNTPPSVVNFVNYLSAQVRSASP